MKWFKHSGSLRHDPKVKRLVRQYGAEGWTVYTVVVESIAASLDPINKIIPFLEEDAIDIAYEYKIDSGRVKEILDFCIEQGLFEESTSGYIFCFKLYKYVDEYFTKKQKNKEIYADRNKEIINAYKIGGIAPMLLCLKELAPSLSAQIGQIKLDSPYQLQSNSRVTPDFIPQEEIRVEESRLEENRREEKKQVKKENLGFESFDPYKQQTSQPFESYVAPEKKPEDLLKKVWSHWNSLSGDNGNLPHDPFIPTSFNNAPMMLEVINGHGVDRVIECIDKLNRIYSKLSHKPSNPKSLLVNNSITHWLNSDEKGQTSEKDMEKYDAIMDEVFS